MNKVGLEFEIGTLLTEHSLTLAIAESCTGGMIANLITNVPGSSKYFERGIISYSNKSKIELLNVPKTVLEKHGAVSEQTASAMANGIRTQANTDLGLAVTGIVGPTGGSPTKPVGLVYIGFTTTEGVKVFMHQFNGSRMDIKKQTSQAALKVILDYLNMINTKYPNRK